MWVCECQSTGTVSPLSSLLLMTGFQLPANKHIYQTSWTWLPPASEILWLEIPGSLWTLSVSLYSGNPSSILDPNSTQTQSGLRPLLSAKITINLCFTCTTLLYVCFWFYLFKKHKLDKDIVLLEAHVPPRHTLTFALSKMLSDWCHVHQCSSTSFWIQAFELSTKNALDCSYNIRKIVCWLDNNETNWIISSDWCTIESLACADGRQIAKNREKKS